MRSPRRPRRRAKAAGQRIEKAHDGSAALIGAKDSPDEGDAVEELGPADAERRGAPKLFNTRRGHTAQGENRDSASLAGGGQALGAIRQGRHARLGERPKDRAINDEVGAGSGARLDFGRLVRGYSYERRCPQVRARLGGAKGVGGQMHAVGACGARHVHPIIDDERGTIARANGTQREGQAVEIVGGEVFFSKLKCHADSRRMVRRCAKRALGDLNQASVRLG
jgi:hypothetical protein